MKALWIMGYPLRLVLLGLIWIVLETTFGG